MTPWLFGISDFSMLELVTLAQVEIDVVGRSALADAINREVDVHSLFGADMLGIPYESFNKERPEHKRARQGGKAWNFGKPGRMGQSRFIAWARKAYKVEVTPADDKAHTARWHRRFPEHREYWRWVDQHEGSPYRIDKYGRRQGTYQLTVPRCGLVRGGMGGPDAANCSFQSLGAFVAKRAVWLITRAMLDPSSPLAGAHLSLFVHDENVSAIPAPDVRVCESCGAAGCKACHGLGYRSARVEAAVAEQERLMIEAAAHYCPDVRMGIESIIADRYKKG